MKACIFVIILSLTLVSAGFALDVNVADRGAVGDMTTDNTAIFQTALDDVGASGGGIVTVPAGHFRINGNLSIPANVTLQGSYTTVPEVNETWLTKPRGSTLLAYAGRGNRDGEPFIRLKGNTATIAGFVIFYPEWNRADIPPIPYPPCIASSDTNNVTIQNCNIINAYEAISLVRAHRHMVRNVYGYPIWRGIYVDECYDIGRIENIHFWPFGANYRPDDPYSKWINLNGTAFEFARTDWQYVTNTFCFGYGVGYKFSESANGSCNGSFLSIGADSCRRAVLVEQASNIGLLITNGEFVGRWESTDSACVEISPKALAKVSFNNCSFWGPNDKCIWMRAPGAQLTAIGCNFVNWDVGMKDSPAIAVDAGNAIIQGNTFGQGGTHVLVGKDASSVIVIGNQAASGLVVENKAGARTILSANQPPPVVLSASEKACYTISIGSKNDEQFLKHWQGAETASEWKTNGTKRWSSSSSQFILPVLPKRKYQVTLDVYVPTHALQPGAGLYLGNKQILKFTKAGEMKLTGVIPASAADEITLDVRCKNWMPKDVMAKNEDTRVLGVAVRAITLKALGK